MADDKLVESLTLSFCQHGRHNCIYPKCGKRTIGRCQTAPEHAATALAAIDKAGSVVISREPTEADIERMAREIYDRVNLAYHSGALAAWVDARDIHRDIAVSAACKAHAALVLGR